LGTTSARSCTRRQSKQFQVSLHHQQNSTGLSGAAKALLTVISMRPSGVPPTITAHQSLRDQPLALVSPSIQEQPNKRPKHKGILMLHGPLQAPEDHGPRPKNNDVPQASNVEPHQSLANPRDANAQTHTLTGQLNSRRIIDANERSGGCTNLDSRHCSKIRHNTGHKSCNQLCNTDTQLCTDDAPPWQDRVSTVSE
jgi:hypothetical protein